METIEYTTVDKSEWGDGPWQNEPDKVQYMDEDTGLPCIIKRGPVGAWCGYVGVAEGHPAFESHYYSYDGEECVLKHIEVHGGLTFANKCQEGAEEDAICHIPGEGEPDHVWWLGFDCAHAWDISPVMLAYNRKKFAETGDSLWDDSRWDRNEVYRDINYVRGEVKSLAKQLAGMT